MGHPWTDRRRFLQRTAAAATGLPFVIEPRRGAMAEKGTGSTRRLPATGNPNPDLRPFDRMMAEFVARHRIPGAAFALSRGGRLIYQRGYGFADVEKREPVAPDALFRIASISKPLTAVAVLQLAERGWLKLGDPVLDHVSLRPHLEPGEAMDPRWKAITIRQLLQHSGGWDREQSFDPIGRPEAIAKSLGISLPVRPADLVRYMLGRKLDFDPGERFAYSNFGYVLLGRVIESVSGQPYETFVKRSVLAPLGITRMRLGRGRRELRQEGEVHYYDPKNRMGRAVSSPPFGEEVPLRYGGENFEAFEAHGGWIASAPDLVRFAAAFDDPETSPLLDEAGVRTMWARPELTRGNPDAPAFYGCGWQVRPIGSEGKVNAWHTGRINGTSTLLVRRWDGLDWAVLFNTHVTPDGQVPAGLIDPLVHRAAAEVERWP